ncbi:hypothetical protein RKD30_003572 [Streptomyces pristinaespiralis]
MATHELAEGVRVPVDVACQQVLVAYVSECRVVQR